MERGWGVTVVGRVGERVVGARACGQRFIGYKNAPRRKPVARRSHQRRAAPGRCARRATTAALRQTRGSPNDTKGTAIPTQLQSSGTLNTGALANDESEVANFRTRVAVSTTDAPSGAGHRRLHAALRGRTPEHGVPTEERLSGAAVRRINGCILIYPSTLMSPVAGNGQVYPR